MAVRDVLRQAASSLVPRGAVNTLLRWTRRLVGPDRFDSLMGRGHRRAGYELLQGHGIEIGALHAPAPLASRCAVTYVDAMSTADARKLFPEIDAARLVPVDIVADMDGEGLAGIGSATYDFAVHEPRHRTCGQSHEGRR